MGIALLVGAIPSSAAITMSTTENCNTCKYAKRMTGSYMHLCRRYPPQVNIWEGDENKESYDRPWMAPDNWCGEWKAAAL